jgi:hypothetical protein
VIIDTLCGGGITRGVFVIEKSGIILRQSDKDSTILYDVNLPCTHLRNYKCDKPMVISFNLKHMQGLLKAIKKKDRVTMHIDANHLGKLSITIRPEGARDTIRFETKSIAYQLEEGYVLTSLPDGEYKFPMVINASDFQKIKQLTTISKKITITIQKSNYLSFKCDAGVVMDAELGFGQFQDEEDIDPNECVLCKNQKGECWCECDECGEYICDCWCVCNECGEYKGECTCVTNGSEIFSAEYRSSILNKLVKLPGLCAQMQFYAPPIARYPLRIEVDAGQSGYILGKIQIYIKDVDQINYEESLLNENDHVVQLVKAKGKGKKKN